jgi:eukaryotic-like serine/threonine-protein kinase
MAEARRSLRTIFNEASEIERGEQRRAYLDEACGGDAPLRRNVEELLSSQDAAGSFLSDPERATDEAAAQVTEREGDRIGRYRLIEKIGEGGCGVVYLAEQIEPVRRRVAFKIIKLGMDTRSVVARFEAERQALALMDHPSIAQVLDAGATERGRPFFVMELVRGTRITEYCEEHRLTLAARLELFIQVCQAVQHAHQKGIIHRDLKPSNILVTSVDGRPLPKVIDFGIAKATADVQLTDETFFTRFELFVGTPAYMSPEQTEFNATDIDTRTDIYSLGVLLYELLTGRPPFDAATWFEQGLDKMRKAIREEEPIPPSAQNRDLVAASRKRAADLSTHNGVVPMEHRFALTIPSDLDWIVLKALEKDRTRRYATANGFAADIRRHLNNEPVVARPPSALYSFRKLVWRNRPAFAIICVLALLLVAGIFFSLRDAARTRQAEKAERVLRERAEQARNEADSAQRAAQAAAEESRQRLVKLNVFTGNRLVLDRDNFAALLWFAEAWRLDRGNPERDAVHRRRFAATLRGTPKLVHVWMHEGFVESAEFSADGNQIVTASIDKTARLWSALTGAPIGPPLRHHHAVSRAFFTPSNYRVVTSSEDGKLRFWDPETGRLARDPLPTTAIEIDADNFSPDGRWLAAPVQGGVQLFDAANGEPTGRIFASSTHFNRAQFSKDGRWLAAFGGAGGVSFWEVAIGRRVLESIDVQGEVRTLRFNPGNDSVGLNIGLPLVDVRSLDSGASLWPPMEPGGDLYDFRFSPDGRIFATASWDGVVRLFETATGRPLGPVLQHQAGVRVGTFNASGDKLVTASWDTTARVWDPRNGASISPALHHAGYVSWVSFSPAGNQLVTASQDKTVRLWEFPTNGPARLIVRHVGAVRQARFSPDGQRFLTSGVDKRACIWDTASGRQLLSLEHQSQVLTADFGPTGDRVATGCFDGSVHIWDAHAGMETTAPLRHTLWVRCVQFSPDGRRLLTASDDGTAQVWNVESGEPITEQLIHRGSIVRAFFSRDGRSVVTASMDFTAQVWNAVTGKPIAPPFMHVSQVHSAAFSPDGTKVVTAVCDQSQLPRSALVWNIASGKQVGEPLPHRDGVLHVEFSPDGRFIASASMDKTAVIWDAITGKQIAPPLRHTSYVMSASFSPDSTFVLTIGYDGTARVWETTTGEPITPPLVHDDSITAGAWRPDGKEIITSSYDGSARIWDISPGTEPLESLKLEAELLSASRLDPEIGPVSLTAPEMNDRWQMLRLSRRDGKR